VTNLLDNVSLLVSEGHIEASGYPIWYVAHEADVCRRRIDNQTHTDAVVMQAAMAASQNKKAFPTIKKLVERFT
jgi:hypothetical protein